MRTLGSSSSTVFTKVDRVWATGGQHASHFADAMDNRLLTVPRVLGPAGFGDRSRSIARRDLHRFDPNTRFGRYATATTFQDAVDQAEQLEFDEVADVVCTGPGAGGLAAAIAAADAGLKVVVVEGVHRVVPGASTLPDRLGVDDDDTADYLDSLTQDLRPINGPGWDSQLPVQLMGRGEPGGRRGAPAGAFVGSRLKDWAAGCLASPYGVLYSRVFDRNMVSEYTLGGELVEVAVVGSLDIDADQPAAALDSWLQRRAGECDIEIRPASSLQRLVFDAGQVVGAVIDGPGGPRSIRASRGVVMATGAEGTYGTFPDPRRLQSATVQVAVVSRPASRFARVELLAR